MLSVIGKTVVAGAVMALGLGFGANKAAADSFSVSVHTPGVSAGYSNHRGHDHGYVDVYRPAPAPVVVYNPPVVVVEPRHVCAWDRVPVSRVRYDECGRRIYYTEYVKVRTCDDYHRRYNHHHHDHYYKHGHHGKAYYNHGHHKHHDDHHHKHGKHDKHDKYDDRRYSRNWDDHDRDHERRDNHRGRDRD